MNPEQWLSLKWNGGSTMSDRWLNQSKIIHSKKAEKTKDDIEKQTIDLNSKEYDMSRNKEYIEDLFSAQKVKKWKKLTLLEKRVRLEYIIKNQCVKLGMETVPPLILSET